MSAVCQKQEEAIPALAPLTIPPRPQTLTETPTSQAFAAYRENPQISPETLTHTKEPTAEKPQIETLPLTQETNPSDPIPQTEAETPKIEGEELEEADNKLDTEESEEEEDGCEQSNLIETGEELGAGEVFGSRDEKEEREDAGDDGGSEAEEGEENESEVERVEKQKVENDGGKEIEIDGRMGAVEEEDKAGENEETEIGSERVKDRGVESSVADDKEVREKEGERGNGDTEQPPIVEEEVKNEGQEIETEIVVIDDNTTDDQGTPTDGRAARRQSRQNKKSDEDKEASGAKRLRLSDIEETGEDIPQAQEDLAAEKDISLEAMEMRYEAELKRKGKHATKPQKKKARQVCTTMVITETTPETIRVPFTHPTEEEAHEEAKIP